MPGIPGSPLAVGHAEHARITAERSPGSSGYRSPEGLSLSGTDSEMPTSPSTSLPSNPARLPLHYDSLHSPPGGRRGARRTPFPHGRLRKLPVSPPKPEILVFSDGAPWLENSWTERGVGRETATLDAKAEELRPPLRRPPQRISPVPIFSKPRLKLPSSAADDEVQYR
jgi:hypothetical protein